MEIKLSWCYLCFALLCTSLYGGVGVAGGHIAGGLAGVKQHRRDDCNEGIQENENIVDRKLESLQKSILDLKDSMTAKIELITSLEYDQNKKINEITNNIQTEQTTNITKHHITDKMNAAFWITLESTVNINQRLAAIEKNQNSIFEKLDKLENNRHREINELTDKINLLPAKLLTEKTDLAPIETTTLESTEKTNIGAMFENSTVPYMIQYILNMSRSIQPSPPPAADSDTNQQTERFINNTSVQSPPNDLTNDTSKIPSLCDVTVPDSLTIDDDIWVAQQRAAEDELDKFMVNKTGCTYRALHDRESLYLPTETYTGTYEWHGAVRARDRLIIGVLWAPWTERTRYDFYVGDHNNTVTVMYQRNPWTEVQRQSTAGILSDHRYVPVYIRIQAGTLTFGRECDQEPLFRLDVSIPRGNDIRLEFFPFSSFGAKYLYECPSSVAGRSGKY